MRRVGTVAADEKPKKPEKPLRKIAEPLAAPGLSGGSNDVVHIVLVIRLDAARAAFRVIASRLADNRPRDGGRAVDSRAPGAAAGTETIPVGVPDIHGLLPATRCS